MKEKIRYYLNFWIIYSWHIFMFILILITWQYFYELPLIYLGIYLIVSILVGYILKYKKLVFKISTINYLIYLILYGVYIYLYFKGKNISTELSIGYKTTYNTYWPGWLWLQYLFDSFIDYMFITLWLFIIIIIDLIPHYFLENNSWSKKNK